MNESITTYQNLKAIIADIFSSLKLKNREHTKGRKPALTNIEAVTCAVLKQQQNIETKQSLYDIVEPPCSYNTFVVSINRTLQYLAQVIALIINVFRKHAHLIKFTDATETPVCLLKNSKHHKTMAEFATKSKSSKGYYFGLKTHLSADLEGRILALKFTSANGNDREAFIKMNEKLRGLFVTRRLRGGRLHSRLLHRERAHGLDGHTVQHEKDRDAGTDRVTQSPHESRDALPHVEGGLWIHYLHATLGRWLPHALPERRRRTPTPITRNHSCAGYPESSRLSFDCLRFPLTAPPAVF